MQTEINRRVLAEERYNRLARPERFNNQLPWRKSVREQFVDLGFSVGAAGVDSICIVQILIYLDGITCGHLLFVLASLCVLLCGFPRTPTA